VLCLRADLQHQAQTPAVELLKAQGVAANQPVAFLTDGGEDIRELPRFLNPGSEHLLDWFA
jgi:hypothetical protein